MFPFLQKRNRLTPEQEKAEKEAIRLLNHAKKMLLDDWRNVDEAKRIRFEVTHKLLPPKKMYIAGKHPRSLLRDLDKRINYAYIRQIQASGEIFRDVAPAVQSEATKQACMAWQNRYGSLKGNVQRQLYWSLAFFFGLSVCLMYLLFEISKFSGSQSFAHSFNWLSR